MQTDKILPLGVKERRDIKKTLTGVVVGFCFFLPWVYIVIGMIIKGSPVRAADIPLFVGFLFFAFLLIQEAMMLPRYYRRLCSIWIRETTMNLPCSIKIMYSVFTTKDKKSAKIGIIVTNIVFLINIFCLFVCSSGKGLVIFSYLSICCIINIFHSICILKYADTLSEGSAT